VLRASTTMIAALASGASAVIPCGETDEARACAAARPHGTALLGGERGGTRITGFDLGNSPLEYTPDVVKDKTVVFTTTNGTRALLRASAARRVIVGAFANLHAVVDVLLKESSPAHIVCAGTDGQITLEDCLCAGAMAYEIRRALGGDEFTSDCTNMAAAMYESLGKSRSSLVESLRNSRGGRNLIELGYDADIDVAARIDTTELVPEFFSDPPRIVPFLK
jgi:2-phosphosulfolactate phosphatase